MRSDDRTSSVGDEEARLIAALNEASRDRAPERLNEVILALGAADAFLLSVHGSPLAPNARTLVREGKVWTIAFSSAARAAHARKSDDGILRAPMATVCAAAAKSGQTGVFLNPGDAPWILVTGSILHSVATAKGSGHPIAMVEPDDPASLAVEITDCGEVLVDGAVRTLAELRLDLEALKRRQGTVEYTRAHPGEEPADTVWAVVRPVLGMITELKLPVKLVERVRPARMDTEPDTPAG